MSEDAVDQPRPYRTDRADGRCVSSLRFSHAYMRDLKPGLAFDPGMSAARFPGSSGTREYLANEPEIHPGVRGPAHADRNRMALEYVRAGMGAVAVDHPGTGEVLERQGDVLLGGPSRDKLARDLLYMGRSFVGLSSYQKMSVLEWLKTEPRIDAARIAVSGHSLGTEPVMVLAALDTDVCAMVHKDFVHGKREQDLAIAPSQDGRSVFMTGGMWHCVPGLWQWLDLPDILAAGMARCRARLPGWRA